MATECMHASTTHNFTTHDYSHTEGQTMPHFTSLSQKSTPIKIKGYKDCY